MPQRFTINQRIVGFTVSVLLVAGFSLLLWYSLSGRVAEREPGERYFVAAFSVMMIVMGFSGLLRVITVDDAKVLAISAILFTMAFAIFGGLFIAVGLFGSHRIAGGIPFVPDKFNQFVGASLFIGAGVVVLLFLPKIYKHKRDDG